MLVRGRDFDLAEAEQSWHWRGRSPSGELLQLHDLPLLDLPQENASLALQAYALLGLPWQPERQAQALAATQVSGRLERRNILWQGKRISWCWMSGTTPMPQNSLLAAWLRGLSRGAAWPCSACWRTRTSTACSARCTRIWRIGR